MQGSRTFDHPPGIAYSPGQAASLDMQADSPRIDSPPSSANGAFAPWSAATASTVRERLSTGAMYDLVVVGAGISGAGVARDAARRGLRVLVLDAADVAYGTSSRSSRLIHGGVRYLEQGQMGLVYEALRERARLYESASHLVTPARFLFPAYAGDRLSPWKLRIGLTLYDTLNFFRSKAHDYASPERCAQLEPLLRGESLRGAVLYEDAVTDDARLTLTVLQDALRHGAEILTYAPVRSLEQTSEGVAALLDDGLRAVGRQLVVATGPWTGRRLLGTSGDGVVFKSKGIHLVLRAEDVPVRQPVVVQAPGDRRRILFVVPWGSRTYLGTTDVPYEGDPGRAGVTPEEEAKLLQTVAHVLPNANLRPEAVISAWSGVRPLVRPEGAGADTVEVSRKHRLVHAESGAIGLVGGKLTTYRAMAEEVVDLVVDRLRPAWPDDRPPIGACDTDTAPLVPGNRLTSEELADPCIADLHGRHGPLARALAEDCAADPSLAERLVTDLPYRRVELRHAVRYEGAQHVADVLRRRLPLALTDPALGGAVARETATMLVEARGGSALEIEDELNRYRDDVQTETGRSPAFEPSAPAHPG